MTITRASEELTLFARARDLSQECANKHSLVSRRVVIFERNQEG